MSTRSGCPSRGAGRWGLRGVLLLLAGAAAPLAGQSGIEESCLTRPPAEQPECLLAVATTRAVQERVGIALWGGNPVPGTASTLGMRIGSTPRYSASGSLALVPATLPPLLDRSDGRGERVMLPSFSMMGTVAILPGWSPLPTIGGVLSVDVLGGLSVVRLPDGFQDGAAVGWQAGVRVGALRESFTMPGVSVTASYGRSGSVTYGDPPGETTDGFTSGSISDLSAMLAASRRISAIRLTGGVAAHRYVSDARVGYGTQGQIGPVVEQGTVTTSRRSWFANASWTSFIFHSSAELGWQQATDPSDLPDDVRYSPSRWWAGVAFRVSI